MAMIQCRECKAAVSDEASKCPRCGAPVSAPPLVRLLKVGLALLALGLIVAQFAKTYG